MEINPKQISSKLSHETLIELLKSLGWQHSHNFDLTLGGYSYKNNRNALSLDEAWRKELDN